MVEWSSFLVFVAILIPSMIILDAATIYHIKKIKNAQIIVWYFLSNLKPHYSASKLTAKILSISLSARRFFGIWYTPLKLALIFLYVNLSFYLGASLLGVLLNSKENLYLDILSFIVTPSSVVFYLIWSVLSIHVVFIFISIEVIGFFHKKLFTKGFFVYFLGVALSFFVCFAVEILSLMLSFGFILFFFEVITGGWDILMDAYRVYLAIPLFSIPFLMLPSVFMLLLSVMLSIMWCFVFPIKELAERVVYVQANDEKQGLFSYLAGFLSALFALFNVVYRYVFGL